MSNADADLTAVMNGGQAFVDRLAQLQEAKRNLDAATDALQLGKSARAANDEAARTLAAAKEKRDADMAALAADIANAKASVAAWSKQTKALTKQGLDDAAKLLSEGAEIASGLRKTLEETLKFLG